MQVILSAIDIVNALDIKLPDFIEQKARTFKAQSRKESFIAGRKLLSFCLKELYGISPMPEYDIGPHGKPFFTCSPHFFNLSHSSGFIALSLGDFEQGIDLEFAKKRHNLKALISKTLSQGEQACLGAMDSNAQMSLFPLCWTLREALIKESGLGLIGIDALQVDFDKKQVYAADNHSGSAVIYYLPGLSPLLGSLNAHLTIFTRCLAENSPELSFELYLLKKSDDAQDRASLFKLDNRNFEMIFAIKGRRI